MAQCIAPRILISATASNSGKTSLVCGLLRALQKAGYSPAAYKSGPDYIDPMFHQEVIGVPSRNLDLFFSDANAVRELLAEGARNADINIIEGAMGYYDGIQQSSCASAFDLAQASESPVVLIVNGRGRALSAAAEVVGFTQFRSPSHIAGVILNRVSPGYFPRIKAMIENEAKVKVLGYMPPLEDCGLESRHLGLVTADEVEGLEAKIDRIAHALDESIDFEALLELAHSAPPLHFEPRTLPAANTNKPHIALARDEAFKFYYSDTLRTLEELGATLVPFSPIHDKALPQDCTGLYLGGGYPELYAEKLSTNETMRSSIRSALASGLPTIAECGGFMYLHSFMEDNAGKAWPMVGAIEGKSYKTDKLSRFGYVHITAQEDTMLCKRGETLPAHEFHYWDSENPGNAFHAHKPQSSRGWECAFANANLYAGYPHLYLYSQPQAAKRFVDACADYANRKSTAV